MIIRVAYGVIIGNGAQDTRSDDEGEEDEMMDDVPLEEPLPFQEVESEAEDIHFARKTGPARRKIVLREVKQGVVVSACHDPQVTTRNCWVASSAISRIEL